MTTKSLTPILVPTDEASNLILDNNKLGLTEIIHANKCHSNCNAVNQILLLIDQEAEINSGDWFILDNSLFRLIDDDTFIQEFDIPKKCLKSDYEGFPKFKIIATSSPDHFPSLSSISSSDIQWMVEEYNKNGKLPDKIEVETQEVIADGINYGTSTISEQDYPPTEMKAALNPDGSIRIVKPVEQKVDVDKLTPLELHHLLYDVLDKLEKLPYVYDEKNRVVHNDYFASNKQWHYDAREEIEKLIDKYGSA